MPANADDLIQTYGAALARVAASYERDTALREELLQDIFMAVVSAAPRLREPEKVRGYIFRIAHNRAVAHVIKRMRDPGVVDADYDQIVDDAPTPEQSLISQERSAALLDAVRRLPLPHRQVITLVLEDLSYPEIADALGISQNNVGVRITRAKHLLKALLDHDR